VSGTVTTAEGVLVASSKGAPVPVSSGGAGRWAFRTDLTLADARAGAYVLTLEARSLRHPDLGRVQRQVPFHVAAK
jgi:hypothetical protein